MSKEKFNSFQELKVRKGKVVSVIFCNSVLALPRVAFCPPKGTNTALNFDLLKLSNTSLSTMQKKTLKEAVHKHFNTGGPQMDFVSQMEAVTNKGNIRHVYAGFQSYPTTEDNNTKIQVSFPSGKIQTPGFAEDSNSQQQSGKITYTLKFPSLGLLPPNQTLVLEIVADMDKAERLLISGGDLAPIVGKSFPSISYFSEFGKY